MKEKDLRNKLPHMHVLRKIKGVLYLEFLVESTQVYLVHKAFYFVMQYYPRVIDVDVI